MRERSKMDNCSRNLEPRPEWSEKASRKEQTMHQAFKEGLDFARGASEIGHSKGEQRAG